MTRYTYGGGGDSEVNAPSGVPRAGAAAGVYDSRLGGAKVTDILDMSGAALGGNITTDAYGQAIFQGPNGYTATLWIDYGVGPRWGVSPKDMDQAHAGGQIIVDQRTADYAGRTATTRSSLPTNATDPLLAALATATDPLLTPRFPSAATRNANYATPADGDQVYRTDLHARQTYNAAVTRWVTDPTLIGEAIVGGSTTNAVTFSSIPQEWNNLRVLINAKKCSTSSQTHKVGVETTLVLNADTTANYQMFGTSRITKWAAAALTYGVLVTDGSGGSATVSAAAPGQTTTALVGAFCGTVPGESTAANQTSLMDITIPGYSAALGQQAIRSQGGWDGFGSTVYMGEFDLKGSWGGLVAVTSATVQLFTGAFFGVGSSIRLYGF